MLCQCQYPLHALWVFLNYYCSKLWFQLKHLWKIWSHSLLSLSRLVRAAFCLQLDFLVGTFKTMAIPNGLTILTRHLLCCSNGFGGFREFHRNDRKAWLRAKMLWSWTFRLRSWKSLLNQRAHTQSWNVLLAIVKGRACHQRNLPWEPTD